MFRLSNDQTAWLARTNRQRIAADCAAALLARWPEGVPARPAAEVHALVQESMVAVWPNLEFEDDLMTVIVVLVLARVAGPPGLAEQIIRDVEDPASTSYERSARALRRMSDPAGHDVEGRTP